MSAPYVDPANARAGTRVYRLVQAVLEDVRAAERYRDVSTADGEGDDHRHHARGGIWNDRTGRAAHGIALADVAALRRELRAIGAKVSVVDADALLLQAEMGVLLLAASTPAQERTKKANRRAKVGPSGVCRDCCVRPARPGRTTCVECAARKAAEHLARKERGKTPPPGESGAP